MIPRARELREFRVRLAEDATVAVAVVLAEKRRGRVDVPGRSGQLRERRRLLHRADLGIVDGDDVASGRVVRSSTMSFAL